MSRCCAWDLHPGRKMVGTDETMDAHFDNLFVITI